MKKKLLELLISQKMEIVTLITQEAIELRIKKDKGQLNNLQRALKLNDQIIKIVKNEEITN